LIKKFFNSGFLNFSISSKAFFFSDIVLFLAFKKFLQSKTPNKKIHIKLTKTKIKEKP